MKPCQLHPFDNKRETKQETESKNGKMEKLINIKANIITNVLPLLLRRLKIQWNWRLRHISKPCHFVKVR